MYKFLCGHMFLFLLGIYIYTQQKCVCVYIYIYIYIYIDTHTPRSGIAESYSNSMFNTLRNCQTLFQSYSFLPSHQQWALICYCLSLILSHFSGCEVVTQYGSDFHFPDGKWCWAFFIRLLVICISSLEKCLF